MKRFIWLFFLCTTTSLLCSCQNQVNTLDQSGGRVINDGFLNSRLIIQGAKVIDVAGEFATAQVVVSSARTGWFSEIWSNITSDYPYKVEYKISWKDKNGRFLSTATSTWIQFNLWPGEVKYLSATAPTPECKDFTIQFKELN